MGNQSSNLINLSNSENDDLKMTNKSTGIEDLPGEILIIIYQKLDSKNDVEYEYDYDYGEKANASLINASRVSKGWKKWIDGKIITMNFSYVEKTSRITYRLERFHNLRSIDFGCKSFDYEAIFSCLVSCPNVEALSIPIFYSFHSFLPSFIESQGNLRSLSLTYFPSSYYPSPPLGRLLSLFVSCTKLQCFQLDYNLFEADENLFLYIGDYMPSLTHLNLKKFNSILSKSVVYILNKCTLLKVLQLEFANINNDVLVAIANCKCLEEIHLRSPTFDLENPSTVALNPSNFNLRSLNITRCRDLTTLFSSRNQNLNFPALLHLNLSYCHQIMDYNLYFIMKTFKRIQTLDLSYTKLIQTQFENFEFKFENLKILRLGGDACTDDVLKLISLNCSSLEELSFINTAHISDHGIRYLIHGCKSIHSLFIKNDREKWTGSVFSEISGSGFDRPFPNLKHLVLGRCKLTDEGLGSILLNCTGLTRFEFYLCKGISSLGIFPFLVNCPKLKHFELNDCSGIELEDLIFHSIKNLDNQKHNHANSYNKLNRIKIKGTNKSDKIFVEKVNDEWVHAPKDRVILGPYLLAWFEFQNKTICLRGIFFKFELANLILRLRELRE